MSQFPGPTGLTHNRGPIADPTAYAKENERRGVMALPVR